MNNGDNNSKSGQSLSRRRMLALSAVGVSGGIAGCGSGETDGDSSGNGNGDGEQMFGDRYWNQRIGTPPADLNHNWYRQNSDWYLRSMINTYGVIFPARSPSPPIPVLFSDWQLQDDDVTLTIELNEDFYWHDGDNVTAQDIVDIHELHFWMQAGQAIDWLGLVEGGRNPPDGLETALPEVVDEYTFEYTLENELNPAILEGNIFGEPYSIAPQQYRDILEEFRDTSEEDALSEIRTRVGSALDFETDIGFGPLEIVDQNEEVITLEFFDDYPFETVQEQIVEAIGPDNVETDVRGWGQPNFAGVRAKFLGSNTAMEQEVRSESIDGGVGPYIPDDQLPSGRVYPLMPIGWGQGIMFNMWTWGDHPGEKHLNPRRFDGANDVRKALALSVDRELAAQQLGGGPPTPHDEVFTGLLSGPEESTYSDDLLDQFEEWEQDYDRAAEYFESAGFSMENDVWHTPEGEPWQPIIKDGAGVTRYVNMWEVASSNFEQAGIDIQVEFEENSTFFSSEDQNRGYDLTTAFYGAPGSHPWFGHDWTWRRPTVQKEGSITEDWLIPGNPYDDEEEYIEVPPVGEPDSSERQQVYPKDLLDELQVTQDEDREQEILETLAWAANWWIPKITLHEHQGGFHLNTNGWHMPDPEESVMTGFSNGYNTQFPFGIPRAEEQ